MMSPNGQIRAIKVARLLHLPEDPGSLRIIDRGVTKMMKRVFFARAVAEKVTIARNKASVAPHA